MKRKLFVFAAIALAIAFALPVSSANAGHYGVRVWVVEPTVYNADPGTGSTNALLSDGKGAYPETTDTYAHVNDWATSTT